MSKVIPHLKTLIKKKIIFFSSHFLLDFHEIFCIKNKNKDTVKPVLRGHLLDNETVAL